MRNHLKSGLGLRQVIDWMMYVNKELDDDFWENGFGTAAVDASMDKFSSEHDGSEGWSKEDITKMVKEHGGDNTDVLKAIALGMCKCLAEDVPEDADWFEGIPDPEPDDGEIELALE